MLVEAKTGITIVPYKMLFFSCMNFFVLINKVKLYMIFHIAILQNLAKIS